LIVVAAIAYYVGAVSDTDTDEDASNWAFALKAILGGLLLLLALKQWSSRPKDGDPPAPQPEWMEGIDQFTPAKSFGLGALLAGPNPKNLLLSVAAGTTIAQFGATGADAWVAIVVYALIGTITVGGPVLYYFVAGERAERTLNELKGWLGVNNTAVVAILFLIIGISLLSDGLQELFA
jgi:threonine/homoserine/homoserine lactone efflux protein